ncbi:MAG: hypothetical protein M3362_20570, partial [Acidobacteriota bacterium]|nr:hypothetical protein [Acidobacteriota bacterium]
MGKRGTRARNKIRELERQLGKKQRQEKEKQKIKRRVLFWRAIVAASVVVTIISGYFTIIGYWLPRITIQPLAATNPKDALSAKFSLTNQGSLPIYNVSAGFRYNNVTVRDADSGEIAEEFVPINNVFDVIPPNKSATINEAFASSGTEQNLDIWITVRYRP